MRYYAKTYKSWKNALEVVIFFTIRGSEFRASIFGRSNGPNGPNPNIRTSTLILMSISIALLMFYHHINSNSRKEFLPSSFIRNLHENCMLCRWKKNKKGKTQKFEIRFSRKFTFSWMCLKSIHAFSYKVECL